MAKAKPKTTTKAATQAEPQMFEATCPACGMTADVGADVEAVRCKRCGTIVQLVDHAPDVPAPPAPAAATAAAPTQVAANPGLAVAIGLGAPVLLLIAYGTAHSAIDRLEPDTTTAGVWYMVSLLGAAASGFGLRLALAEGQVFPRALWALFAAVPMFMIAQFAGMAYDDDGFAWVVFGVPFFGAYLLAIGIAAAVLGSRRDGSGPAAVLVGGVGLCIGLGASALYMLMTLQEQAVAAREAHEAPAWGLALVAGVLLALAAYRRRAT